MTDVMPCVVIAVPCATNAASAALRNRGALFSIDGAPAHACTATVTRSSQPSVPTADFSPTWLRPAGTCPIADAIRPMGQTRDALAGRRAPRVPHARRRRLAPRPHRQYQPDGRPLCRGSRRGIPEQQADLVVYLTRPPLPASAQRPPWPEGYSRAVVTRRKQLTNGQYAIAVKFDADWSAAPPDVNDEDAVDVIRRAGQSLEPPPESPPPESPRPNRCCLNRCSNRRWPRRRQIRRRRTSRCRCWRCSCSSQARRRTRTSRSSTCRASAFGGAAWGTRVTG